MNHEVKAWVEEVIIPTYETGMAEKNPIFLEKRVYQGSSGTVYPHPVIESISNTKSDKKYKAVFIENEYLKIMVLPELGGRIHRAYDKIRKRDFVYYNQVIKPALVGLTGPWISGGIEFNWPQHHRPSTFLPIDFTIEEGIDGSRTVWVNEVEKMFRTKGMAGFTLYPGKAFLEIKGRLYNRTPFPQTFLWWANPAVKVNDSYQSVFPPDVYAVFDHGKRDVSSFPIATGTYYKIDYSPGTDISRYSNIPVPTSYMAIRSNFNFIGGYEHDTKAGLLHVANHHISPGKKQWTWGNGDFGKAWDRNLTDEDGPYIELMCGVYTDNQPDFAWLQPNEEKTFEQYFMPYAEVGMVKNATKYAAIGLEKENSVVIIKAYATSIYSGAKLCLFRNKELQATWHIDISPNNPISREFEIRDVQSHDLWKIVLLSKEDMVLVSYEENRSEPVSIPSPAKPADKPKDISSIEKLYLNGLHIEQYRHATYDAADYYLEALAREPQDIRCNNAMGLYYMKRFQFSKALPFFNAAVAAITDRNPNPYDGEPYFNLGWCLHMLDRNEEAYDAFYKAVWNDAWQHVGYLNIARLDLANNDWQSAIVHINKSLVKNSNSHTALHVKSIVLRKLGKEEDALDTINQAIFLDPFNFGCLFEGYLIHKSSGFIVSDYKERLISLIRSNENTFIEYALDYAHAGLYTEAISLLELAFNDLDTSTMLLYYYAWLKFKMGDLEISLTLFKKAAACSTDYVFPNKAEDILVLQTAIRENPLDSNAWYYLGNIWYAVRQYEEAIICWEKSAELNESFPTTYRNLALAYHNILKDEKKALRSLERAFELDTTDARVLMELDQLRKKLNFDPSERLGSLINYKDLVQRRDDLYLELITIYNTIGLYEEALDLIECRSFHPWEGGEGKVVNQFLTCILELAKNLIHKQEFEKAIVLLERTDTYPQNLGEGKLKGAQENDIHFLKGCAYEGIGDVLRSINEFKLATQGIEEPVQAIFYNDPQPDKIFYQGLAWNKLENQEKANTIFNKLIAFGEAHMNDVITIDYFAVSLPDLMVFDQDLQLRNVVHCNYLIGLGYLGLRQFKEASVYFNRVLDIDVNHLGARVHGKMFEYEELLSCTGTLIHNN